MLHAPPSSPVAALTSCFPTSHVSHKATPSPEYCPTPQSSQNQDSAPGENVEASQSVQSALLTKLKVPAAHEAHALSSALVAVSTKCLPRSQAVHNSLVEPAYRPDAHGSHESLDAALCVPAEHD